MGVRSVTVLPNRNKSESGRSVSDRPLHADEDSS